MEHIAEGTLNTTFAKWCHFAPVGFGNVGTIFCIASSGSRASIKLTCTMLWLINKHFWVQKRHDARRTYCADQVARLRQTTVGLEESNGHVAPFTLCHRSSRVSHVHNKNSTNAIAGGEGREHSLSLTLCPPCSTAYNFLASLSSAFFWVAAMARRRFSAPCLNF